MTHEERIALCKICSNRSFDSKLGIACSLTGRRPDFIGTTKDFMRDEHKIEKELKREEEAAEDEKISINTKMAIGVVLVLAGIVVYFITNGGWLFYGAIIVGLYWIVSGLNGDKLKIKED